MPKPPIALYSALADATRCRILELLRGGAMPVHVLAEAFSISRPAISRHLRVLKTAGLVAEVKKGRENLYAFKPAGLAAAKTWVEALATAASGDQPARSQTTKPAPHAPRTKKEVISKPAPEPSRAPSASQMGFDF